MWFPSSAAHQSQLSVIETLQSMFVRHASRLAVVREQKEKKQAALLGQLHIAVVIVT